MSDPMGLSIGTTNLVAARVGNPPVMRRSMLTISGELVTGFVERVGDPVPVVTADGTSHPADELVVEAIAAMVADDPSPQVAVAVPAHWSGATLRALRTAMRKKPNLAPNGGVPRLVSDSVAALTALHVNPGLPAQGVIALLDFGGGGTSITLADAAASFEPIDSLRYEDFSGDHLDQALLARVLDGIADAGELDPAGTQAVGSLTQLRDDCRQAKEALSEDAVTEVGVELPGYSSKVIVTRQEFEALVDAGLAGVLTQLEEMLLRNRIQWVDVTTVALVGGGARIPLIARRLSEHTQSPLVTSPVPALDAAVGAAIVAAYTLDAEAATGVAAAPLIAPAELDDAAPDSATFRALAWSQADDVDDDSLLFTDETAYGYDTSTTRAVAQYVPAPDPADVDEHRSWQRLPQLVFGIAVVAALLAVGGVAVVLTTATDSAPPRQTPSPAPVTALSVPPSNVEPPAPPPPVPSVVTVTEVPPPPPPPPPPVEVTTTHATIAPTRTTPPTTTTTPPTTTTTTETTTTTTTTETTTSSSPTMTTSYITVPFVPVPIPVQVPVNPNQPPSPQYPQQYPGQYPYQQQPQYPY